MMDEELRNLLIKQGEVIATLSLRISTLEQLLLEKEIFTESDIGNKAVQLSKEFSLRTKKALIEIANRKD